ncbi:hypothetical protein ACHGLA_01670 [Streptomyces sp. YH02]|uniref:hypothetical protein n=1 Tax=Streptomyces sp. YH02 TaxID=3256999 RepID=UPI003756F5EC
MIKPYDPQFSHKDWIDNQDRVKAGGADGLNSRFHLLEDEFAGLAKNQINPMLDALGTSTRHLTLVPALISYTDVGGAEMPAWAQQVDMVDLPNDSRDAHGFMSVVLPDGALVQSLLVTGENQSDEGTLTVALVGRRIDNLGAGPETLVSSTKLNIAAIPQGGEVEIMNETHRYLLTVDMVDAELNATVQVFCAQIVYQ